MLAPDGYRLQREELLSNIVQVLSSDERFVAGWLTGSFARSDADAVSDLDLTVVVSGSHSDILCQRIEQVSPHTSPERLELFSMFGKPAMIHENNTNAPDGGTFTFILYAESALMVDWILVPQAKAVRPHQAVLLFEKIGIPVQPPPERESESQRAKKASEVVAFFWMMMAVTAKYIVRGDRVFVTQWLEELTKMLREVERLVKGQPWEYSRGSLSKFELTIAGQKQALIELGEWMQTILPDLAQIGGHVLPAPMPEIETLLGMAEGD